MSDNLPAKIPSLARAFETERENLRLEIIERDLSSNQAVTLARRALDKTGDNFTKQTEDMQLQKAGLWLLEMVKSGSGILDRGTRAEIVWREIPNLSKRVIAGSTLFYGSAAVFFVAGILQASKITMMAAFTLAAMRFFDPKDWKNIVSKIPFIGRNKTPRLEAPNGQHYKADTHISVEAAGYVDTLADALRTADHILMRLSEPQIETHWREDGRLMNFVQGLLEAKSSDDTEFAFKLVGSELESILRAEGVEIVHYSRKTAKFFDVLPALDMEGRKEAAPALLHDGEVLRRGTIWKSS